MFCYRKKYENEFLNFKTKRQSAVGFLRKGSLHLHSVVSHIGLSKRTIYRELCSTNYQSHSNIFQPIKSRVALLYISTQPPPTVTTYHLTPKSKQVLSLSSSFSLCFYPSCRSPTLYYYYYNFYVYIFQAIHSYLYINI